MRRLVYLFVGLFLQYAIYAQQPAPGKAPENAAAEKHPESVVPADERPSVPHHKIALRGKFLTYTATAGHLPIKNEQRQTEAQMFCVAYTLDLTANESPANVH